MRRTIVAVTAVLSIALMSPAQAITYGEPDGEGHPEVGALLAPTAYSDGTWVACSGTLISPTVFLTAAHCAEPDVSRREVTFASRFDRKKSITYWGTWHADPNYNQSQSDPHDIAVVVLDGAVRGITPARLPQEGSLSNLSGTQKFTSVGYGAQRVTNAPGGKQLYYEDVRWVGVGTLNTVTQAWLKISQNPSHGDGGTCYGDSGGPNFLGAGSSETNIVAGTTITGDVWCRSTNVDYRLDSASARDFLRNYVALP
jgi:V8-like Glu-specific endopeptidase